MLYSPAVRRELARSWSAASQRSFSSCLRSCMGLTFPGRLAWGEDPPAGKGDLPGWEYCSVGQGNRQIAGWDFLEVPLPGGGTSWKWGCLKVWSFVVGFDLVPAHGRV